MPQFHYVAVDPGGQIKRGVMEADDRATVIERLQRQGDIPMRADTAGGESLLSRLLVAEIGGERGLSRQELTNFTRELATMLGAGQDIDRALRFLVETAPNVRVKGILEQLRDKVRGGSGLAKALALQPRSFDRLYVGLVRAGEAGGTLAETLQRLAELMERQRALVATIQSAMIYPAMLILVAVGAVVLLLTYVLPQFVPLFQQSGAQLPGATQFLMSAGQIIGAYGLYALLALLALGVAFRQALKDAAFKRQWDRRLLRLPLVGAILSETIAARFTRTLGTLLQNGVPLIAALSIVKEAMTNMAAVDAIEGATESAKGGAGLARPLESAHIFPTRTLHLLRLGEETGQLAQLALRAAEIHEEKVRLAIQRLVALMVPAITVAMGGMVAGIVASLMMAMMSLNNLAG